MKKLTFSYHKPGGDRRHYVTEDEVRIVLDRLPAAVCERLKTVHFNDRWREVIVLDMSRAARCDQPLCVAPASASTRP